MRTITMNKKVTDHLFAHLYEHVFFIHVDSALRNKELVAPIDYSLDASTSDGEITITLDLFDTNTMSVDRSYIESMEIDTEMEITEIALNQIQAEYEHEIAVASVKKLMESLTTIHHAPWNTHDVIDIDSDILILQKRIPTKNIRISLPLMNIDATLRPLLRQIAGVIINTLISDIADTYGGFVTTEAYRVSTDRELEAECRLLQNCSVEVSDIQKMSDETIIELTESKAFDRLLEILNHVDLSELPPDAEKTLQDTGVLIDTEGWREIASQQNLQTVLEYFAKYTEYSIN